MEWPAVDGRDRLPWLDPAVLVIGAVRRDAEEHNEIRAARDGVERGGYKRYEPLIVRDVVIGGKDRHRGGRSRTEPQESVEDCCGRAAVDGLDHAGRVTQLRDERRVERLVGPDEHGHRPRGRNQSPDPLERLLEERRAAQQPAELLGATISRDPLREALDARALSASQDQGGR
jgi:hypothetical protein